MCEGSKKRSSMRGRYWGFGGFACCCFRSTMMGLGMIPGGNIWRDFAQAAQQAWREFDTSGPGPACYYKDNLVPYSLE